MNKPVPFSSLKRFLEGLGFQTRAAPGKYVVFKHSAAKALIVLRFYQDDEALSPTDLAIVRRVLDDFGLMERSEFEERVRELSLEG